MKISLKQILAVGALAVASTSAFADVQMPNTGNGELALFVYDATQNTSYGRGLGVNMNDLITNSQIAANGYSSTPTQLNVDIGTLAPDANMTAFLGSIQAGDTVEWAVIGGDSATNSNLLGSLRYATTDANMITSTPGVTNLQLRAGYSNLDSLIGTFNDLVPGSTVGDKGSAQPEAAYGDIYDTAPTWWGNGNIQNAVTDLGTTANFYLLSTGGGTSTHQAQVYSMYSLTLGTDGTLSMNAPMSTTPIPAAFWLLGSGLAGLVGIGRRKQA